MQQDQSSLVETVIEQPASAITFQGENLRQVQSTEEESITASLRADISKLERLLDLANMIINDQVDLASINMAGSQLYRDMYTSQERARQNYLFTDFRKDSLF